MKNWFWTCELPAEGQLDLQEYINRGKTLDLGYSLTDTLDTLYSCSCNERACEFEGRTCLLLDDRVDIASCRSSLFTRIRMDDLPQKIKVDGTRLPLQLDDDEGLGEHVAMAYHQDLNILALQSNRFSSNGVCTFLERLMPGFTMSLTPILSRDALDRFSRCHTLRKVRIKVAGTDDLSFIYDDKSLSVDDKIAIQQMMKNPYVDYTISMGYKTGSLNEKVRKIVDFFKRFSETEQGKDVVQYLQITGKEENESQSVLIDLLSERLTHEQKVSMKQRTVDTNHLLRIACASIAQNTQELRALYVEEKI